MGVGFHLPTSYDYIYGEITNLSDRPIEHAMITATLPIISGSWPSTTTAAFIFTTRFPVTLPGNSNPFIAILPLTAQLGSIAGEPLISVTTQFGNSDAVQRIDILQLYSVTLSIWRLPLCNAIFEFPITDALKAGESISTTIPFCPYGGPLHGALGAVAQGKSVP